MHAADGVAGEPGPDIEEEDEEVAGLRAAAAAAAPKKKKKGSEPELPTTCPSVPGGNLLKQELEVAYDVSRAEVPPAGHDAVVGVAPAGPCAADLVDKEELGASPPALPPAANMGQLFTPSPTA